MAFKKIIRFKDFDLCFEWLKVSLHDMAFFKQIELLFSQNVIFKFLSQKPLKNEIQDP
jgi:hypothetical protein